MSVTTQFKGGTELQAALRALGDSRAINAAGRKGLKAGAEPIRDLASSLAPEWHGLLKQSIKVAPGKVKGTDRDHLSVVVGIDQNVDPPRMVARERGRGTYRDPGVAGHSVIIEFGRAGAAAEPYMTPAMDAGLPLAPMQIAAALWPAIKQQAQRLAGKVK